MDRIKALLLTYRDDLYGKPGPMVTEDGEEVWLVKKILDRRRRGRGWQYQVRWQGYGPGADSWIRGTEAEDLAVFNEWLRENEPDEWAEEQAEEEAARGRATEVDGRAGS